MPFRAIEINKEITQLTKLNYELENKQIELENHKIIIIILSFTITLICR